MKTFKQAVVPAYLLLCLIGGGSAQGVWNNMMLQLLAAVLIAWAVFGSSSERLSCSSSRKLIMLLTTAIGLIVLQLVPLPPAIWSTFPGRGFVENGYGLLGLALPWLPASLNPYETLAVSYSVLPPIAVITAMLARRAFKDSWIAIAVVAGALASVVIGAAQAAGGADQTWTHFYALSSPGVTGFFANRNHMATLLLAAIPFATAIYVSARATLKQRQKAFAMLALGLGSFVLMIAGIALNASLAALALSMPVLAFSSLLLVPAGSKAGRSIAALSTVAIAGALGAISTSSIRTELTAAPQTSSFHLRAEIWSRTAQAVAENFPVGSGLGTFRQAYTLNEPSATITQTYINHAHNDYLELVLETGLLGLLLLGAFLIWWAGQAIHVWRFPSSTPFAKAATIASAAILAHSSVDYPLRTAAIAGVLGACLGLMASPEPRRETDGARHMVIG